MDLNFNNISKQDTNTSSERAKQIETSEEENSWTVFKNVFDDIREKKAGIIPTTGKDIEKHINAINKDNILEFILFYGQETNNSEFIISDIMWEIGLPFEERAKYCEYIMDKFMEYYQDKGIYVDDIAKEFKEELEYQKKSIKPFDIQRAEAIVIKLAARYNGHNAIQQKENIDPNGKIDENFKQGEMGDCWLLSSIKALALEPKGQEILNNSIKKEENGDVTVTLKGVNKSYTFTQKDIEGRQELSTGDLDVRTIEMAFDKYFSDTRTQKSIEGNTLVTAFEMLTGKKIWNKPYVNGGIIDFLLNIHEITKEQMDRFNNKNHVACVASCTNKNTIYLKAENGEKTMLIPHHAYTVSRMDKDDIYLINPWDTSTEIKVDVKTFTSFFDDIIEFDL